MEKQLMFTTKPEMPIHVLFDEQKEILYPFTSELNNQMDLLHSLDACIWCVKHDDYKKEDKKVYDEFEMSITTKQYRKTLIFAHGGIDIRRVLSFPLGDQNEQILITDVQTLDQNGFFMHTAQYAFERQITEFINNLNILDTLGLNKLRDLKAIILFLSTGTALITWFHSMSNPDENKWDGLLVCAPNLYSVAHKPLDVLENHPEVFTGAMIALIRRYLTDCNAPDELKLFKNPAYLLSNAVHNALLLFGLAFDSTSTCPHFQQQDQFQQIKLNGKALTEGKFKQKSIDDAIQFLETANNAKKLCHPIHIPLLDTNGKYVTPWSMYKCLCIDGFDIARRVMEDGLDCVYGLPVLRRKDFRSFDQNEALNVLHIETLIERYLESGKPKTPLNLMIFGIPGAGKSFFIKQMIKALNERRGKNVIEFHTFNLSQINDEKLLNDAFQQVRDDGVKGSIPLLFLDEFDTAGFKWLKYFIAPMQDGQFIEGSSVHIMPRCILVFAGGVSNNLNDMMGIINAKELKIPDFISRLHGVQTVWGVNPTDDDTQRMFIARRACILKNEISERFDNNIKIDEALHYALLHVTSFKHGARSIGMLVNTLTRNGNTITKAWLPSEEALGMFLDVKSFKKALKKGERICTVQDALAKRIHDKYNEIQDAFIKGENKDTLTLGYKKRDWDSLSDDKKACNREPIWHLESRLVRHNLQLEELGLSNQDVTIDMDALAHEEHMRWMSWRLMHGTWFGYGINKKNGPNVSPYLLDCETLKSIQRGQTEEKKSSFELDKALNKLLIMEFMKLFTITDVPKDIDNRKDTNSSTRMLFELPLFITGKVSFGEKSIE